MKWQKSKSLLSTEDKLRIIFEHVRFIKYTWICHLLPHELIILSIRNYLDDIPLRAKRSKDLATKNEKLILVQSLLIRGKRVRGTRSANDQYKYSGNDAIILTDNLLAAFTHCAAIIYALDLERRLIVIGKTICRYSRSLAIKSYSLYLLTCYNSFSAIPNRWKNRLWRCRNVTMIMKFSSN